ncbi:hypothetical protein A3Q56_08200 [Intoshia linei]|uniref:General transcription factor TFIIB n=1 Tax=Intoshia linei TaxID=1819745 RepID=A0A177ARE8_9BILA|nr:hypothetical protein A3Q56_08200 [Intoshia linei]
MKVDMNKRYLKPDRKSKLFGRRTAFLECPYHPKAQLVEDHQAGDMICTRCGIVVGDRVVDVTSEWRTFGDANAPDKSRIGAADDAVFDGELSTVITMDASTQRNFSGLARSNMQIMGSDKKSNTISYRSIKEFCEMLNLNSAIQKRAMLLIKDVRETKKLKYKNNDALAAACIYIAARQEGVGRTFKEICSVSNVAVKYIGRVCKKILRALETNIDIVESSDFMIRFCSNLSLPIYIEKLSVLLAQKSRSIGSLAGRSPVSIAAASIAYSCSLYKFTKSLTDVSSVIGVAEYTIKKTVSILEKEKDLIPQHIFDDISKRLKK